MNKSSNTNSRPTPTSSSVDVVEQTDEVVVTLPKTWVVNTHVPKSWKEVDANGNKVTVKAIDCGFIDTPEGRRFHYDVDANGISVEMVKDAISAAVIKSQKRTLSPRERVVGKHYAVRLVDVLPTKATDRLPISLRSEIDRKYARWAAYNELQHSTALPMASALIRLYEKTLQKHFPSEYATLTAYIEESKPPKGK